MYIVDNKELYMLMYTIYNFVKFNDIAKLNTEKIMFIEIPFSYLPSKLTYRMYSK